VTWMTRQEAADYLKVSVRTLARLSIPRSMVNSTVRYSRDAIDLWMDSNTNTPHAKKRATPRAARIRRGQRIDADTLVDKILKRSRR
jgi:hypothetical protein